MPAGVRGLVRKTISACFLAIMTVVGLSGCAKDEIPKLGYGKASVFYDNDANFETPQGVATLQTHRLFGSMAISVGRYTYLIPGIRDAKLVAAKPLRNETAVLIQGKTDRCDDDYRIVSVERFSVSGVNVGDCKTLASVSSDGRSLRVSEASGKTWVYRGRRVYERRVAMVSGSKKVVYGQVAKAESFSRIRKVAVDNGPSPVPVKAQTSEPQTISIFGD